MKILFSHSHVIYKGGWGRTFPFAEELVKQGHEVTIITMANKMTLKISLLKINGVKIVTFPSLLPIKNYYDPISILLKLFMYFFIPMILFIQILDSGHNLGFPVA